MRYDAEAIPHQESRNLDGPPTRPRCYCPPRQMAPNVNTKQCHGLRTGSAASNTACTGNTRARLRSEWIAGEYGCGMGFPNHGCTLLSGSGTTESAIYGRRAHSNPVTD